MPASGPEGPRPRPPLRAVFMGTPEWALPSLATLAREHELLAVYTQPDRPRGRGRRPAPSPVKRWALARGVPVYEPVSLNDAGARAQLERFAPDVIVVAAYGLLLPAEVLRLPPLGCVNVHGSLLPRYRGASPVQAAILAGDEVTGVTTMLMDEGLDTGPILLQRRVPIRPDDTAGTLAERLSRAGGALLAETLRRWSAGTLQPRPQDPAAASLTTRLRKRDGRVDWTREAAAIERHVRAMQPWPVAWTSWRGQPLRLWRVRPGAGEGAAELLPGGVRVDGERLLVACGDGWIELLELQRAGGRRLPAGEFLRGAVLAPGERFGSQA